MRYFRLFCRWPLLALTGCLPLLGQAVISTHSGVVNYTEGTVLIDDKPFDQKSGVFSSVREGSVLRTEQGRAEVLLTPGVLLRLDENSAFRMTASALTDTKVEFLQGSAIVDANAAADQIPVEVTYRVYQMRFRKPGVYRVDAEPGVFETYTGEAEITMSGSTPEMVDDAHQFFFNVGMKTRKYGDGAVDTFSEWARDRAEKIAADNQATALALADPPPDTSVSPFGAPSGSPSFAIPPAYGGYSGGGFAGTLLVDNGFLNYGPGWFAPPFINQIYVFYVYPRWRNPNPVWGHSTSAPGYPKTGYPGSTSFPVHAGYPVRISGYPYAGAGILPRSTPLYGTYGVRSMPSIAPARVTVPRVTIGPGMRSAPTVAAPHVGGIAHH